MAEVIFQYKYPERTELVCAQEIGDAVNHLNRHSVVSYNSSNSPCYLEVLAIGIGGRKVELHPVERLEPDKFSLNQPKMRIGDPKTRNKSELVNVRSREGGLCFEVSHVAGRDDNTEYIIRYKPLPKQ